MGILIDKIKMGNYYGVMPIILQWLFLMVLHPFQPYAQVQLEIK